MPDEARAYAHGCASAQECQLAEVLEGYKARARATGRQSPEYVSQFEGRSPSTIGAQKAPVAKRRR